MEEKKEGITKVGISISDSHDLQANGFGTAHQKDVTIEFFRHLLANNYGLVFGHDLRVGGYAELFAQLARVHLPPAFDEFRCENYLAWPFRFRIDDDAEFELEDNNIKPVLLPKPENVDHDTVANNLEYHFVGNSTRPQSASEEAFKNWTLSLYEMRRKMTEVTHARIFIGGQIQAGGDKKKQGYSGRMPGVVEEGLLAIEAQQPAYFIGAFGGATHSMIQALLQEETPRLSLDYQGEYYGEKEIDITREQGDEKTVKLKGYKDRVLRLNKDFPELKVDYDSIKKQFGDLGIEEFSKRNGLTIEENFRLFETPHISEMVRLVLKGLNNVFPKSTDNEV